MKPRYKSYTIHDLAKEWEKHGINVDDILKYLDDEYLMAVIPYTPPPHLEIHDFGNRRDVSTGLYNHPTTYDLSACNFVRSGSPFRPTGNDEKDLRRFNRERIMILLEEVERFESEHKLGIEDQAAYSTTTTKAAKKTPPKGGKPEPITELINSFLDENYPRHSTAMFYEFVKNGLASKSDKKKDDKFTFPVKKLGTGLKKGVYMEETKRGLEGNQEENFWYSHKDIGERISRAKTSRKLVK